MIAATGAELVAHVDAMEAIEGVDRGLKAGDHLTCGSNKPKYRNKGYDPLDPGHTMSHICLYFSGSNSEDPALFCGDTLFNAGVGRCDLGGAPKILHQTFIDQIFPLPDAVRVYPGHDYIENNLAFTLDREPDNHSAQALQTKFKGGLDAESYVSTLGMERKINVFFRTDQPAVRQVVAQHLNLDVSRLDDQSTFVGLRKLRDSW